MTGLCLVCERSMPGYFLIEHLRVSHPAQYGSGPALTDDGDWVRLDQRLQLVKEE